MIKGGRLLDIIYIPDLPAEDIRACDVVCSYGIMQHDALLFIANPGSPLLRLGKRSHLKFYDLEKLEADGVYVNRADYGGSGALFGPRDVTFNLHLNKFIFEDEYDVEAADVFQYVVGVLMDALNSMGLRVRLDQSEQRNKNDGVCIHLQGRSEIVTDAGHKLVVSVYREDEMGIYINAAVLVSDAWTKIYNYLISPMDRLPGVCVESLLGRKGITERVIQELIAHISHSFSRMQEINLSALQLKAIEGIRDQYRVTA